MNKMLKMNFMCRIFVMRLSGAGTENRNHTK